MPSVNYFLIHNFIWLESLLQPFKHLDLWTSFPPVSFCISYWLCIFKMLSKLQMSYVLGLPFMSFSPFFPCVAEVWEMISWKIIASMCCMLPLLQCLTYIISNNPFSHTCCGCLYHHLQRRNLWCIEVKWLAHSLADGLWQNQCSPLFPCDSVMHSLDWSLTIYYDLNFCRSWTFRGFSQKLSNLFTDDSHTTFFFWRHF